MASINRREKRKWKGRKWIDTRFAKPWKVRRALWVMQILCGVAMTKQHIDTLRATPAEQFGSVEKKTAEIERAYADSLACASRMMAHADSPDNRFESFKAETI